MLVACQSKSNFGFPNIFIIIIIDSISEISMVSLLGAPGAWVVSTTKQEVILPAHSLLPLGHLTERFH